MQSCKNQMQNYCFRNEENGALYAKYRDLAERENNVIFGGRLGEYKYYDMDKVILSALEKTDSIK